MKNGEKNTLEETRKTAWEAPSEQGTPKRLDTFLLAFKVGQVMGKKAKFVMIGQCPNCHEEFIRKPPVDTAVCMCAVQEAEKQGLNPLPEPITIPLKPAIILSSREHAYFSRAAEFAGVTVEELLNCYLIEAAKEKLACLQPFPSIVVTTSDGLEVSEK